MQTSSAVNSEVQAFFMAAPTAVLLLRQYNKNGYIFLTNPDFMVSVLCQILPPSPETLSSPLPLA